YEPLHGNTELAPATGLLLVLAFRLGTGRDRLPIGNRGKRGVDLDAEVPSDTGEGHIEMVVAQTRQDRLAGLGAAFDPKGRVGLSSSGQGGGQLLFVLSRPRCDGHLHDGDRLL